METATVGESIAQMRATNFEKTILNSYARGTTQFFMFNCLNYEKMKSGKEIVKDKITEMEERFDRKFDTSSRSYYSNDKETFDNIRVDVFLGLSIIGSNKNSRKKKEDS